MTVNHHAPLDLNVSMPELTRALLDYESVSGNEQPIADAVHTALSFCPHLQLTRDGDAIIARTEFPPLPGAEGERTRIILAGHLDTVPLPTGQGSLGTVPSTVREEDGHSVLYGRGATDMKGGVAVQLKLAAELTAKAQAVTAAAGALDSLLGSLADTAADILDPGKLEDLVARHAGSAQHELDSLMHVSLPEGLNALVTRQTGY